MATAIIANKNVELDISPGAAHSVVHCSQYDSGYQLIFTLYNGSTLFEIPADCDVRIDEYKADKTAYHGTMSIAANRSKCFIWMATQMSAVKGDQICEIVITTTSGRRIGTSNFILRVEPCPVTDQDPPVYSVTQLAIGNDMQSKYPNISNFETTLNNKAPLSMTTGQEIVRPWSRGQCFRTVEADPYRGGTVLVWHNGPVVHVTFSVTFQVSYLEPATERIVIGNLPATANRIYLTPTIIRFSQVASTDAQGNQTTTFVPNEVAGQCVCTMRLASESRPVKNSAGQYVNTPYDHHVLQIDGSLNPKRLEKFDVIYASFSYITTDTF